MESLNLLLILLTKNDDDDDDDDDGHGAQFGFRWSFMLPLLATLSGPVELTKVEEEPAYCSARTVSITSGRVALCLCVCVFCSR